MVYLIAISTLLTALLSGCGETKRPNTAETTPAPKETMLPADMMPDESDGIVNDTDGIITENDNGENLVDGTGTGTDTDTNKPAISRGTGGGDRNGSGMSGTTGSGKAAGMR